MGAELPSSTWRSAWRLGSSGSSAWDVGRRRRSARITYPAMFTEWLVTDPMMDGHWGMPPGGPWDGPWGGQGAGGLFSEKLNEFLRTDLTEFGPNKPEKAKNPPATSDPSTEPTNEQKSENERKMPQNEYHRNGWNDHFEHDRFFGSDPRAGHNEHQHEPYAGFQSNGRFNPEQDPQSTIQNPMDRLHGLFREYDETMEGQWVEHDPHMMHQRHRFHSHEPHMMHQHQRHAIHTGHGRHSWRF